MQVQCHDKSLNTGSVHGTPRYIATPSTWYTIPFTSTLQRVLITQLCLQSDIEKSFLLHYGLVFANYVILDSAMEGLQPKSHVLVLLYQDQLSKQLVDVKLIALITRQDHDLEHHELLQK